MTKRSPTTKDIALLHQLFSNGQLTLATEFQRNAVWPAAAKAYLIDTILNDRPVPLLFFQRTTSAQTGQPAYSVIDGQQRLLAIFDYLSDRFKLTQSAKNSIFYNKRFSELPPGMQEKIRNYDLIVEELSGYSDNDIRDMFVRMNRYVVKLSRQELRHAKASGKFHEFVEKFGRAKYWIDNKVFSPNSVKRMRAIEYAAEISILLIEGPQDKKSSIELYYVQHRNKFPDAKYVNARFESYTSWLARALPGLANTRYRSPVDFYSLMGALDRISQRGGRKSSSPESAGRRLLDFDRKTKVRDPRGEASRYLIAASRQTDNLIPRTTRIDILESIIRG